jgi:sialic acid synthase SpsE
VLKEDDVMFQRPGGGVLPSHLELIVGLRLKCNLRQGQQILMEHFCDD